MSCVRIVAGVRVIAGGPPPISLVCPCSALRRCRHRVSVDVVAGVGGEAPGLACVRLVGAGVAGQLRGGPDRFDELRGRLPIAG